MQFLKKLSLKMRIFLIGAGVLSIVLAFLGLLYPDGNFDKWLTLVGAIVAFTELLRRLGDKEPDEVVEQSSDIILKATAFRYDSTFFIQRTIGTIAVVFPFLVVLIVILIEGDILSSLSSYYYSAARDVYVGCLCSIGILLLIYPTKNRSQLLTGIFSALCCFLTAFFPATPPTSVHIFSGIIHYVAMSALFGLLTYYSIAFFESDIGVPTRAKIRRRPMYIFCRYGIIINLIFFIFAVIVQTISKIEWGGILIFINELALFIFFGLLWVTKGRFIIKES